MGWRLTTARARRGFLSFLGAVLAVALTGASHASAAPLAAFPQSSGKPAAKTSAQPAAKKPPSKRQRARRRSRRGQAAPTRERIKEIQSALAARGFYAGEPSGKWDSTTVESMKRFQQANGLNPSGKLDAKSLQELGLGSETAGAAPPRPSAGNGAAKKPPS